MQLLALAALPEFNKYVQHSQRPVSLYWGYCYLVQNENLGVEVPISILVLKFPIPHR